MRTIENEPKLTHSTDESDLDTIFAGDSIFSIPYFQREYIWSKTQLNQLKDDLLDLVGENEDLTFLGAIILYSRQVAAGRSRTFEVVDGQQRLTTITLFLLALVKQLCKHEEYAEAAQLFERYIFLGKARREISNLKLHPCKQDRAQFNKVVEDVLSDGGLVEELRNPEIVYLPSTGKEQGNIITQFNEIEKFLDDESEEGGYDRINSIYQALVKQLTIVQIVLKDPSSCPRIFERLNYRGQKVSIGDLVRNEIFARVVNMNPEKLDRIYHNTWEPFYKKFPIGKSFEGYFFPFGLIKKPSLKKSEVFTHLRNSWVKISNPETIIKDLTVHQESYLYLTGVLRTISVSKKVKQSIDKLVAAKIPSSTFPFLMQVIDYNKSGKIDDKVAIDIFCIIDSFITRRAVCGYEPTGLHAVFKGLFEDCGKRPNAANVIQNIKKHKTVPWPDDKEFKIAIKDRAIYGSVIAGYVIKEYEISHGKDVPSDNPQIEHILPQKLTSEWKAFFTEAQHEKYKDTWTNLIPITPLLNKKVSQQAFKLKAKRYKSDSMYATPRMIATEFKEWTPASMNKRATLLQNWAVKRWAY